MKIKEERKLMEKLNRGRTLSEKAYDALCNVIRKMAPGNNRLPSEDDLANNMGVSRATIQTPDARWRNNHNPWQGNLCTPFCV